MRKITLIGGPRSGDIIEIAGGVILNAPSWREGLEVDTYDILGDIALYRSSTDKDQP